MALEWIERYDVRSDSNHEGWAVIVIDSRGFLGVVSDYGNYAFHWGSFEGDFRSFLEGVDEGYLYSKLMHGRDMQLYDGRATLKAIQGRIVELCAEGRLNSMQARDEWALADDCDVDHEKSDGYSMWCRDTRLEHAHELYETMPDLQCTSFCEKVWPRFIELLTAGRCVPIVPPRTEDAVLVPDHGAGA